MNILFLSHYFYPHVGGVEKHVYKLSKELIRKGHNVTVITERFDAKLKSLEIIDGIKVIRFNYPKQKFIGLIYIWYFLWTKRNLFVKNDILHIHDVFVWYLPLRFLFFRRKVYITLHGLEWGKPFPKIGIFQKRLAVKFSNGSIGVGDFLEKYMHINFSMITYGAVSVKPKQYLNSKIKNKVIFVGRLSKDTGVAEFLKWLKKNPKLKVEFVGDGEYRKICEKYGTVHGFTDPNPFLKNAEYVVPGGYLACLEAMAAKCKIKVFWADHLKMDYWKMSPMYKFITNKNVDVAFDWVKMQSWEKLTEEYVDLWRL